MRLLLIALVACAPSIDGPIEHQRGLDRDDAARLERQLAQLPGAAAARVVLHRPIRDPLGVEGSPGPASAAVLIVVDDAVDRTQLTIATRTLVRAAVPEVAEPAIATLVAVHRSTLATVGPFTVEAGSRGPLRAAFAFALVIIAALAGWIAWRARGVPR